jgi:hypothetical protein
MPPDRTYFRDVEIFDVNNPAEAFAGLVITAGMTNRNLYDMVEILIVPLDHVVLNGTPFFHINNERGETVEKDQNPILPGKYYVNASGGPCIITRLWLSS